MQEVRCTHCGKLLGLIEGTYKIKCPRCKTMNIYLEKLDMTVKVDNSLN
ncbi:MAG TPA: hypothetical protein DEF36_01905 [Desulfotomaculum sp.]|nr:hypothetical protein [Desulfotomaculum sp.]